MTNLLKIISLFFPVLLSVSCTMFANPNSHSNGGSGKTPVHLDTTSDTATLDNPIILNGINSSEIGQATMVGRNVSLTSFYMGKTEVTYKQWYEVRNWAIGNGYTLPRAGMEGSYHNYMVKFPNYDQVGKEPTAGKNQPATMMNWYDAIVWCNALSEKEGLEPCYYYNGQIIKSSADDQYTSLDSCTVILEKSGYRLPTEAEWEYAFRYIDGKSWLPDNYVSGDSLPIVVSSNTDTSTLSTTYGNYAWCKINSWDNSLAQKVTHDVATKKPNPMGIYDMSGNVSEMMWDYWTKPDNLAGSTVDPIGPDTPLTDGLYRVVKGGDFDNDFDNDLIVNARSGIIPANDYSWGKGFRVVRR